MKNIHLLPTDKPSRLYYFTANKEGHYLYPNNELVVPRNPNCTNQNIYITSNEEIKVGDWYYNSFLNEISKMDVLDYSNFRQKIILTTDQDLIKDGVQAIDDEFLEWFVKNTSCEEVEINPLLSNNGRALFGYKIIIPKEEKDYTALLQQVVTKQETSKEIAERYYEDEVSINAFINGYKLAQEQTCNHTYILTSEQGHRVIKCSKCNDTQPI